MYQVFKKEVDKGLTSICYRLGFKKKKYNFYKLINENVYATLGFGMATHTDKGHIYVNVTIGVLFKDVEELGNKLTGFNSLEIMQPTIGIQIGYLMPESSFKEWDFTENSENSSLYEDILKNIQIYGFAYQEKMISFNNLFEAFEKRNPGVLNQARDRYLPILYYLKGDKQKGLDAIEEALVRQQKPLNEVSIPKFSGAKEEITIVGSGYGKVDPEYIKFAENYKLL